MLSFSRLVTVFLFLASVKAVYYTRTVIEDSSSHADDDDNDDDSPHCGPAFQGVWIDSSGTAYLVKPTVLAVQRLTSAGNTSLIIGPSTLSYDGTSGPATSVQLDGVQAIYGDTSGNLYISGGVYFIWKYDHSSGIVSRFAGSIPANRGFSGDGGQATAARINYPRGSFLSSNGVLFFADCFNNRIRTVNIATGIIDTFAGNGNATFTGDLGPATSASLDTPISVWGSSDGVIYIAEMGSNRIRQVDSSGIITTFAGNGNTVYNGENIPATSANMFVYSITGDSNGNIFLSAENNYRIQRIRDGIISTIAGDGHVGSMNQTLKLANTSIPGPNSVSVDPVNSVIYFTSLDSVNVLVDIIPPTDSPTFAPSLQLTDTPTTTLTSAPSLFTEIPTLTPTSVPSSQLTAIPTIIPTFETSLPSFRPSNHNNNNITFNSNSHSNEKMSDLHIFYATFFPAFFVLLALLVFFFCCNNRSKTGNSYQEKEKEGDENNQKNDKNVYEKVEGEERVIAKETNEEMLL